MFGVSRGKLRRVLLIGLVALGVSGPVWAADQDKVKVVIGSTSFAWMPLYVAAGAGFFEDEGLAVEIINVPANATPVAAMMGGSADIAGLGTQAAFNAVEKGQPLKLIAPLANAYTSTIFARKDTLREKGVSRESPMEERVKALFGLKLATTAIGAGPHLMYRYLFSQYGGGVNVDDHAEVVPVGNASSTLAAMQKNVVQVSAFSPPVPQKAVADGYAEVLIDFIEGDVPEIAGAVYIVMAVHEQRLKDDPAPIAKYVRGLQRAYDLAAADLPAAGEAARKFLAGMDSELYEDGVNAMGPALPRTAQISTEGLRVFRDLLIAGGSTFDNLDLEDIVASDFIAKALAGEQ